MENSTERNCKNCKFFNCYYIILNNRLSSFGGHCVHDKIYPHIKNGHFKERENCEFWQNKSEPIEKHRNDIIKDLRSMKRKLDEIALILTVDEK